MQHGDSGMGLGAGVEVAEGWICEAGWDGVPVLGLSKHS